MTWLIVIMLVLLGLSYVTSRGNVFSPGVLTTAVFSFCLLAFALFPHSMPALHRQCLLGVGLWGGCFTVSALLMQSFRYTPIKATGSVAVRDVYFWISLLCIPLLVRFALAAIASGTEGSIAFKLREAAINGLDGTKQPYSPFYYGLWVATYLLYLKDLSKDKWFRAVVMGGLVLAYGVVTMSKTLILNFGLMTLFVLYWRKIISTKHILIGLAVLIVGLVFIQVIRYSLTVDEENASEMFELYILRNFNAFDTLKPCSAEHFGEHVFRIYYAVTYKLGLSPIEPISPILPWVYKPVETNTYTVLYPFFLDFGYPGIVIFAILLGGGIGWLYSHHCAGDELFTLLYAYFCVLLVTQYNGEAFFTNLAGHIKFLLLLLIPYIKIKLPVKNDK